MEAPSEHELLEHYDKHLGTAAMSARSDGDEQLAALLVDCTVTQAVFMDALMSLGSDEVWAGVRLTLTAPSHIVSRFSAELVEATRARLNVTLGASGEHVLQIDVVPALESEGWRDRVARSLGEAAPDSL